MSPFLNILIAWILSTVTIVAGGILTFYKSYGAITEKINGVGARVNILELDEATDKEAIAQLKSTLNTVVQTQAELREKFGKLEKSSEHTDELINLMRIDIIQKISDLQRDMSNSSGKIRERVVRLEVINQIESKLGRGLDELMGSEE